MLFTITRRVVTTTGQVTDKLREDWGLINVMKELNLPKYRALGLTEMEERKYGQQVEVIKDWISAMITAIMLWMLLLLHSPSTAIYNISTT